MLPTPLAPLAAWPQFVVWRLVDGKKLPYSPVHGGLASSTNPKDWGTYEQAQTLVKPGYPGGVGFVFTEKDPFWFLDIDGAYGPAGWSQVAQEICGQLHGAAVEVSQSGTGLHLIGSGTPPADHGNRNQALHLELYTKERFVALTGTNAVGDAATDLTVPLATVAAKYFQRTSAGRAEEWTTEPCAEWSGPLDDDALLERALRSGGQSAASAFGAGGVTFADLFTADVDVLAAKWPSTTGGAYDASSADQSFANMLAFWTGKDCERIERIMRLSALARPKWDDHATYLQNTILNACGTVGKVYSQAAPQRDAVPAPPPPPSVEPMQSGKTGDRAGGLMLSGAQTDFFQGCTYVTSINKIATPRGHLLDQGRFDAVYGGYEFVLDAQGKKTTRSAWAAFLTNENYAPDTADKLCFRPETGSGGIVHEGGETFLNTYVAIETARTEGDPTKFLDLMARQLPDANDRAILLNYFASVVQNPGMKAAWWPVLQGLKGNGKTVYLTVMEHCIGSRYTHLPNVGKMLRNGMNFNGWIAGKLFLGLEEIKGSHRREFFEEFKATVTNRRLPIEGKGVEEATADNRANGALTTNWKDGVPIDPDERRYAVFFMAQQVAGDLQRHGMTAAYFADFHDWLFGRGAYAHHGVDYGLRVVNGYLHNFQTVAELDPNRLAIWAPLTSSTREAIYSSRGRAEQEIEEAIETGAVGFAGGWVSSHYLDQLLDRIKAPIPRNARKEMMQKMGFDYHPALPEGRVHSIVQPDNARPRLYIRNGHISANIENQTEAAKAYTKAQDKTLSENTAAAFQR